jgi:hypothetical protein
MVLLLLACPCLPAVEEKGGFIWLFYGSKDLPAEERPPIPYVPELGEWQAGQSSAVCWAWRQRAAAACAVAEHSLTQPIQHKHSISSPPGQLGLTCARAVRACCVCLPARLPACRRPRVEERHRGD